MSPLVASALRFRSECRSSHEVHRNDLSYDHVRLIIFVMDAYHVNYMATRLIA